MAPWRLVQAVRTAAVAIVFVALLLLVALAPAVHGDLEGSAPEATAYTTQRKLVRFSNGTLALAFVIQVNGTNRVQVAESSDGSVWTSLDPPSLRIPSADRPALAVDSRDALHLAWTANGTGDRQVWYASYADGAWSAAVQVSQTTGYSGFPSIAVDSRDGVHVAWYGFDGLYYQIYYRMRGATGWGPQIAVTAQSVDATNPALALDGINGIHIVWYRVDSQGTGFEVSYASLVGANATLQTLSSRTEDAFDPTMVVDRGGQVYVAWTSLFGNASRIAYTVESSLGWSAPVRITPASMSASHASLAIDDSGTVYAFFQATDGQIYEVFQANGTWSPPRPFTQGGNNSYPSARWSFYPVRVSSAGSRVDVVWTEDTGVGYAVRFASQSGFPATSTPDGPRWSDYAVLFALLLAVAIVFVVRARRRHR